MGYIGNEPAEAYSSISKQTITGNGGTSYTLDFAVGTAAEVSVFVNNVRQEPGVAYTVAGTALTMTGAVSSTDDFYVIFQGKAQQTVDVEISKDDSPQLGGNLDVNGNAITGSTVAINGSTGEFMITATENGPVALRYDNNLKLTTKSDGVDITGELQADSLDIDGDGDITGNLTLGGNLNLGDNDKAIFGAGSNLQIYYDSVNGNSVIHDAGAGNIRIRADDFQVTNEAVTANLIFANDATGEVKLYHNGTEKLATTATGVDAINTAGSSTSRFGSTYNTGANDGTLVIGNGGSGKAMLRFDYEGTNTDRARIGVSSSAQQLEFYTAGNNERMRIDSSGNVSLGNGKFLQFKDSGGTARDVITIDAYNGLNINSAGGGSAAPIVFKSNNAETMRIDSSGNVLMGTTGFLVAGAKVRASSISATFEGEVTHASGSGAVFWANRTASDGWVAAWYRGGSSVGSISVTSSSTAYNTSSDYRLKENVVADWDATTRLKQLNPVRFNFIADPDTTVDGFLAHEVQDVVPEAITGTKDGMRDEEYEVTPAVLDEDGNEVTPAVMGTRSVPDYQGIDQSKLVPLLVKTIQELEARITALEAS